MNDNESDYEFAREAELPFLTSKARTIILLPMSLLDLYGGRANRAGVNLVVDNSVKEDGFSW